MRTSGPWMQRDGEVPACANRHELFYADQQVFEVCDEPLPTKLSALIAAFVFCGAVAAWTPFLWSWLVDGDRTGHIQSIVLGGVLLMAAIQIFALGVLADLIASHRVVSQRTLERVRRIELELGVPRQTDRSDVENRLAGE